MMLYTNGMIMMIAGGGADRDNRERRFTNEASSVAGRWLPHPQKESKRVSQWIGSLEDRRTWRTGRVPSGGKSGHDV